MNKSIKFEILFLLIIISNLNAQTTIDTKYNPPVLKSGLSALVDSIQYPDFIRKSNIEAALRLNLEIDQTGNISSYAFKPMFKREFGSFDSIFIKILIPKIHFLKWAPAKYKNENVISFVSIPLMFILSNSEENIICYYKEKESYGFNKSNDLQPIIINGRKPRIVSCR